MRNSENEHYKLLKILGCIFCIPLIPLVFILILPFGLCVNLGIKIRDERLFRTLKARQRVMEWTEVAMQLESGAGTLIIEHANKMAARFWWTPDDLKAVAPFPPFLELEDMEMEYVTGRYSNPFIPWCLTNYLSVRTGKAFLTRFDRPKLPRGPVRTGFFKDLYPRAKIVQTLLVRKRD